MEVGAQVMKAFADVPRPGAEVWLGDPEGAEVLLAHAHWRDIDPELLDYHGCAMDFLTPAGLHYLLPAFMLAALALPRSGLADNVLRRLRPPKDNPDRPVFRALWDRLDPAQRAATVAVVHALEQREGLSGEGSLAGLLRSIPGPGCDGEPAR